MPTSDLHTKQSPLFYPVNIDVAGRRAFVFGGQKDALHEVTRLLEFGASVDLVAPYLMAELQELQVVYGERIRVSKREFNETDRENFIQKSYCLVFALDNDDAKNSVILDAAKSADVLAFGINQTKNSTFITSSVIKRGHLKINVSADGISQAYERSILNRIEAHFVSQIDKYVLFLDRLNEKVNELKMDPTFNSDQKLLNKLTRELHNSEELYLALQRLNFDEADSIVERIIASHKIPQTELA
ncbi:MAG TPA: NAD(P)-dependent oxidoreductase [Drouetiella sp.]